MTWETADFVKGALWPVDSKKTAFFEFSLVHFISTLAHYTPELSLTAILNALMFQSSLFSAVSIQFPVELIDCTLAGVSYGCAYFVFH